MLTDDESPDTTNDFFGGFSRIIDSVGGAVRNVRGQPAAAKPASTTATNYNKPLIIGAAILGGVLLLLALFRK